MSLVSASTLREYLPEIQGTGADAALTSLISRTEEMIARFLGFPGTSPALDAATLTLYVDGPTNTNSNILQLPVKPLVSVSTVHSDANQEYGSSTAIATGDLILDLEWSQLIIKPTAATRGFVYAHRGNKVVGNFGYSTGSPPDDLVHAICVWASQLQRQKQTLGKLSIGQRGNSLTPAKPQMPEEVKEILRPFRSPSVLL